MMTQPEFDRWCDRLNLPDSARKLISQIRESGPVRTVQGNRGNLRGNYSSNKMGRTIQFESHRGELAHIIDGLEYNPDVIEYYDQPSIIELNYLSKSGKKVRTQHTPDFFTLSKSWVGWEEFKFEESLLRESEDKPSRYSKDADGNWRCPPGEEYAKSYNLDYRFISSKQLNQIRVRNWNWLESYFKKPFPLFDRPIDIEIVSLARSQPGITYTDLLKNIRASTPDLDNAALVDLINLAIAAERIFVNFSTEPLSEPNRVRIFNHRELAIAYEEKSLALSATKDSTDGIHRLVMEVGKSLSWDGQHWEITNHSPENLYLKNTKGKIITLAREEFYNLFLQGHLSGLDSRTESPSVTEVQTLLSRARPQDTQTANERYDAIKPYLTDNAPPITKTSRSIRRWRDDYLDAEQLYGKGNGYLGLLPKHLNKGHLPKLDPQLVEFMKEFITDRYYNAKNRRVTAVYREFKTACKERSPVFVAPSEKTFRLHIERLANYESVADREGSRVAKKMKPFHGSGEMPRNGERPWENVHIDHTPLDIELVSSLISMDTCNSSSEIDGDILLGRGWATFMIDAYSRRILAIYLSFEEPSYRSCMMVIRTCVQRFKRLPENIITDNGSEFESIYFKQLIARYGSNHKYRPPGEPRYGSPVERVFGTTNTEFIHELQGNTQIYQKSRQVTKRVNPKNQAIWTIQDLYQSLEIWAYEIYDRRPHASLTHSPREAFELGVSLGGHREMVRIDYDETFKLMTLSAPTSGDTRKVQRGSGVKINIIYYWCDAFRDPEIEGQNVNVKIDPFDVSIAYAYVKNKWHQCISNYYPFLKNRTEKEMKIISADLRQRKLGHSKRVEISEAELVNHLKSAEIYEGEVLKQRLKAMDNRTVLELAPSNFREDRVIAASIESATEIIVEVMPRTMVMDERQQKKVDLIMIEDEDEDDFEDYGKF
jgi:putative transposase